MTHSNAGGVTHTMDAAGRMRSAGGKSHEGVTVPTVGTLPTAARRALVPLAMPGRAGSHAIDGDRLLAEVVGFSRALRIAGLQVDLGAVVDFARALGLVGMEDRELVRAAGATVFVRRHDDLEVYERVFRAFWRRRRSASSMIEAPTALQRRGVEERTEREPDVDADRPVRPIRGDDRMLRESAEGDGEGDAFDGIAISARAYSRDTVDRRLQFDRMSASELREAERCIDLLAPGMELRRTRRRELHARGRLLAPRTMLRRNLKTGGDPVEWVWQRPVRRPRQLIVLCDVSGSMERHARLLLRFSQALATSAVRTEAFVFGTRLTRVTRLLRDRDRDRALARVAEATRDWSGGTRIGECLREFNLRWARRVLRSSAIVVMVSDGWDRGEPALVGEEVARLQRACHRLIWLNPLASAEGYLPLAAGMAAALPYVDDFVPAGTIASLERLAALLADATARRRNVRRAYAGDEAASEVSREPAPVPAPRAAWSEVTGRVGGGATFGRPGGERG